MVERPHFLWGISQGGIDLYRDYLPEITRDDLKLISQPIDFYGQNIYNGNRIKMGEDGKPQVVKTPHRVPENGFGLAVTPECLYWGPLFSL